MPKVQTSQSMQGQKVTCLDGKTRKIVEVIGRGYRVEGLSKAISSDNIARKGGKFVEIEIESRRDIEDSGKGYAVLVSESKPSKGKKAEEAPAKGKGKKSVKEEAPAKGKGKGKKAEEAPSKGKGKKAVKEEAPAKGTKAKAEKAERKQPLVEIDDVNHDLTQEIKRLAKGAVTETLKGRFSNISEVNAEGTYAEGQPVVNITMSVFIDMPSAPVFSMSKKTASVTSAGLWDKLVAKENPTVQKVCAALQLEDVAPQVGDVLVDEDGNQVFFVGIDTAKKKIVLQSVETGAPILVSISQLEAYDMPRAEEADEDDLGLDDEDEDEDDLGLDDEDEDEEDSDADDDADESDDDEDDSDDDESDDDEESEEDDSDDDESDDDEESDDEDDSDDDELPDFDGMEQDEIREYMLENMSRRQLEAFLDIYVEEEESESVADEIAELSDDELVDWIMNFVWGGEGSGYTEEQLSEMTANDLKEVCDELEIKVTKAVRSLPPKAMKKKLIELILEAQAEAEEADEDEDEDDLDSELEDDGADESEDEDDDEFGQF